MHRRSFLGTLVAGGLAGVAGCLGGVGFGADASTETPVVNREVPTDGGTGATFPQFQGSAEHTGRLDTPGPRETVETFWRRTPARYDHSQPVVVDDRIFVSFAGNLLGLDRETGEERWRTDVGHDGSATPAVYDGTVYVTVWNGGQDVARGLAAVDAESGVLKWRALTDADVTTSPAVTDGGVFVGGGYRTSTVAAFDHDGGERWRHDLAEYASTPSVANGTVYYGAGTSRVVAYDAETGKAQWRTETDGETTAAPTAADGRLIVGTRAGTLYTLDARDGATAWTADLPGPVRRSVAVADGWTVVPTEEGLVCLDAAGERRWTVGEITGATAPVVAGNGVYVGDGRSVRALSLADGTEWWSFRTRERSYTDVILQGVRAAPTVTDGVVLVATQAGDVYALGEA